MKTTVKNDAYLCTVFAYSPDLGLVFNEGKNAGKPVTGTYVNHKGSYLETDRVIEAIIRHKNREAKIKKVTTSQEKRRELKRLRREQAEEKARTKKQQEQERKDREKFFATIDASNAHYSEKLKAALSEGTHKKVGAMVYFNRAMGTPEAFVDGYGFYSTLDGIRWIKQDKNVRFIRVRAPAHRDSRGDAVILIPIDDEPFNVPRLAASRMSISGWTPEEYEIARKAVLKSRK